MIGGQAGQELWCMKVGPAYTGFLSGFDEDEMKVDLFSDWHCNHYIETWTTDGCFATNSDDGVSVCSLNEAHILGFDSCY